jgi:N-acetylglucosamine-6-phosphate deacetylase
VSRAGDLLLVGVDLVLDDRVLPDGWLLVTDGRIAAFGSMRDGTPPATERIEIAGAVVFPGFIDVHVHGGGGGNFGQSEESTERAAAFHSAGGTSGLVATLATASPAELVAQAELLAARAERRAPGPRLLGIHLEGPFISPERRGAHDPAYVRAPDCAEFGRLHRAARGRLRTITLAPELPGYADLAAAAAHAGVLVSLGHTNATGEVLGRAIDAGARSLTHTFNAMRPISHRDPGVVEALTETDVFCELICDGVHVQVPFVHLLRRTVGPDRILLITDALAGTGVSGGVDGVTQRATELRGGAIYLAGTDTLIASVLTMSEAVRRYHEFTGADLVELARVAATNAAVHLGEDHRLGRIRQGYLADLTILDSTLHVVGVLTAGIWTWKAPGMS